MEGGDVEAPPAHEGEAEPVQEYRVDLDFARDIPNQREGDINAAGGFRVANYRVLLTYSALHENELTIQRAFEELVTKCRGGCHEIVVCLELHAHPADHARRWHIHAYVWSNNKWDTRDRRYFDIQGRNGRALHPWIQSMGRGVDDRDRAITYLSKDNDLRVKLATGYTPTDGGRPPPHTWGYRVRDAPNATAAEAELRQHFPDQLYLNGGRILKRKRDEDVQNAEPGERFKLEDFDAEPLNVSPGYPYAHVLHGRSGAGKTSFALAHFDNGLLCSTLDDLQRFTPGVHDGIVFDDINFSQLTPEVTIHLLDTIHARSIQMRYKPAYIPANTPRIFTSNKKPKYIFVKADNREQRRAIERRYKAWKVEEDLFSEE